MLDSQQFQALAHLKGKCPGFELEPGVYTGCSCPGPPADCPVCEGSGEVFVHFEMVRVDCKDCGGSGETECDNHVLCSEGSDTHGHSCSECSGRGTVASQDVGDWWEVLDALGFEARPQRCHGRWDITLYSKGVTTPWGDGGEGDTLLEALVGSVERTCQEKGPIREEQQ